MLLRFVYLAFCATLRLLARRRSHVARDAELLVLRHELAVLRPGPAFAGRIARFWPRSHGLSRRSAASGCS